MDNIEKGLLDIANYMAISARTAPKAKGVDNIVIKILHGDELQGIADKMEETGEKTARPKTFSRDAECVRKSTCMLLLGTRYGTFGLDCGFCGFKKCDEALSHGATCAYNSGDLGIAVGSAADTAARFHVDNRILYTAGYTAIKHGLFGQDIRMALGIPMSATGKNPFFDR